MDFGVLIAKENDVVEEISQCVRELLEECQVVFDMPIGLPPKRKTDHKITLKEGVGPVNLQPYH